MLVYVTCGPVRANLSGRLGLSTPGGRGGLTTSTQKPRTCVMISVVRIRRSHPRARRPRWSAKRLVQGLRAAWQRMLARVIENFPPDEPQPTPPLAKAAALREGALLSEYVDARSRKSVA